MYKVGKGVCLVEICGYYLVMTTRDHPSYEKDFYRMNATGAMYWKLLEEGKTIEEISIMVSKKYNKPENEVKRVLNLFYGQLYEMGYLEKY